MFDYIGVWRSEAGSNWITVAPATLVGDERFQVEERRLAENWLVHTASRRIHRLRPKDVNLAELDPSDDEILKAITRMLQAAKVVRRLATTPLQAVAPSEVATILNAMVVSPVRLLKPPQPRPPESLDGKPAPTEPGQAEPGMEALAGKGPSTHPLPTPVLRPMQQISEIQDLTDRILTELTAHTKEQRSAPLPPRRQASEGGAIRRMGNWLWGTREASYTGPGDPPQIQDSPSVIEVIARFAKEADSMSLSRAQISMLDELRSDPHVESVARILYKLRERECEIGMESNTLSHYYSVSSSMRQDERQPATPPVQVLGFQELMRVEQRLVGYSAREVAHVENVLSGETKERTHTTFESNEELVETDVEEESEQVRDLQTSERFELEAESQRTIEREFAFEGGVKVSASYGTGIGASVKLDASAQVEIHNTRSEARRSSSSFAREVIDKSVDRTRKRERELRRSRRLRTVEERNLHILKGGDQSVVGVYKWVDKIYENKLVHYGQRMMLGLFVPEPGAFLSQLYSTPVMGTPPEAMTQVASDINESNYLHLAHKYQTTDIEPPPPRYIAESFVWNTQPEQTSSGKPNWEYASTKSQLLPVQEGYLPVKAYWSITGGCYGWDGPNMVKNAIWVHISVGSTTLIDGYVCSSNQLYWGVEDLLEPQEVPNGIGITARITCHRQNTATAQIYVICERSCRLYRQWQIETHGKLVQAYLNRLSEFNERQRAESIRAGVSIHGANPGLSRQREREELKRLGIQLLLGRPLDFRAITERDGELTVDVDAAAAAELRPTATFFEEAFEWAQSTYSLLPYYWGRRSRWIEARRFATGDPLHDEFLRAGAATVIVPVTPGFEHAVLDRLIEATRGETQAWLDDDGLEGDFEPFASVRVDLDQLAPMAPPEEWQRLLVDSNPDLTYGLGTLEVQQNSADVRVEAENRWLLTVSDVGREMWIEGHAYAIADVVDSTNLELERPYEAQDKTDARYLLGPIAVGPPWQVTVPTSLVVLAEGAHKLSVQDVVASPPPTSAAPAAGPGG